MCKSRQRKVVSCQCVTEDGYSLLLYVFNFVQYHVDLLRFSLLCFKTSQNEMAEYLIGQQECHPPISDSLADSSKSDFDYRI